MAVQHSGPFTPRLDPHTPPKNEVFPCRYHLAQALAVLTKFLLRVVQEFHSSRKHST